MSNVKLLDHTTCDRCGMRFAHSKPVNFGMAGKPASKERCPVKKCGRTFYHSEGSSRKGSTVRVWL